MPETRAKSTEYRWYCFWFREIFREAAPGSTSRELRISRPMLEMDRVTTTAMVTVNSVWDSATGTPREEAS